MHWQVGSSLPYTRRQHEGIHFNFKRGGGAKFLERPFRENQSVYIKRIREKLGDEIIIKTVRGLGYRIGE